MNNLNDAFNQFISIRMESITDLILSQSEEYKQIINECNQLFSDLEAILPQECRQILQYYDANIESLQKITESIMYKEGLKDGFSMLSMLNCK